MQGTVKWFNIQKGYGFISRNDGQADVFVHITALQNAGLDSLADDQKVEFELEEGRNGKLAAQNIKVIG